MIAHTPGPWATSHRKGSRKDWHTEVYSEQYGGIATCAWTMQNLGNGVTGTYRDANARLIAAAPDLLAALVDTLEFLERHSNRYDFTNGKHPQTIVEDARAAIAKAKGASK